jgi:hypothetical protein
MIYRQPRDWSQGQPFRMAEIHIYLNGNSIFIQERYPHRSTNLRTSHVIDHENKSLRKFSGNHLIGSEGVVVVRIPSVIVRNVGDIGDFWKGMSATLEQAQGSASAFGSPLESLHNLIDQLQRNWASI